jgi:class 3 adenylate cyclase
LVTELPAGTLTFVFSDVESSTRLLRQLGERYAPVVADHQRLMREAFSGHGGREVDAQGDSFFVAFARPRDAVLAALGAQRSLSEHEWPAQAELRVRIGIHTGPAEVVGERYVGLAVHRAARICSLGHGGQILLSQATVSVLEDELEELLDVELRDLGEQRLKDFDRGVRIYEILAPGLSGGHPALRSGHLPAPAIALRASDADRNAMVLALREHVAAGRLTLEEFSERTERALAATTIDELDGIDRDLPPASGEERPRRRPKRFTGVFLGATERTGRWRLPRRGFAFVFLGDADLDLRQAELGGPVSSLKAFVLFGNIDLYVPEGVEVDLGGLAVLGHRREWGRDLQPLPGTPLLRVKVFSLFGTADVWRVPVAWARRSLREVIRALESGEHRELPP